MLTQALEKPEMCTPSTNTLQQTQECYACSPDLTFTDEDLLLGSKPHNCPLYVSGYAREQKIDRILIDGGLAVNILPKMTMRRLGLTMEELSHSRLVIQGPRRTMCNWHDPSRINHWRIDKQCFVPYH